MDTRELLNRIKRLLQPAFGERWAGLILYGSEARGESQPDSDIDLLVLLRGPFDDDQASWTCIRVLYPLVLELDRPIHAVPVDIQVYEAQEFPLYREARKEGIMV